MDQVFSHNTNENLHHPKVITDLEKHHFNIEKITLVKVINDLSCDVVAKDKKGFRSYRISLEKNSNYPHLYRIYDIKGQKLVNKYQWER